MAKHTEGPWEWSGDGVWAISPWNARVRLATVSTFVDMNGIDTPANARLIAAAPDLLDALLAIKRHGELGNVQIPSLTPGPRTESKDVWQFPRHILTEIDAALAKAGA